VVLILLPRLPAFVDAGDCCSAKCSLLAGVRPNRYICLRTFFFHCFVCSDNNEFHAGAAIQTHGANNTTPATHRPPDMYGSVSDDGTTTNAQTPREARQHNSTHSGAHSPSMIPSAYNSFELGDRIHFVSPEHILDPPLHESHVTSASKEGRDLPYELVFR